MGVGNWDWGFSGVWRGLGYVYFARNDQGATELGDEGFSIEHDLKLVLGAGLRGLGSGELVDFGVLRFCLGCWGWVLGITIARCCDRLGGAV